MKISHECLPCFLNQALSTSKRLGLAPDLIHTVMMRTVKELQNVESYPGTTHFARRIQGLLKEAAHATDLFEKEKRQANEWMLRLLEEEAEQLAPRDISQAIRLAVAGNIIDLGANPDLDSQEVLRIIQNVKQASFHIDHSRNLLTAIAKAQNILYVGDNAGEIVFDKILVSMMPPGKVTFMVRGGPILNDATRADAEFVGMTDLVPVIDSGSDLPGLRLDECSEACSEAWARADLVIAKGQGNFESLCEDSSGKTVFFLFMAKCRKVADMIGGQVGDYNILDKREIVQR